MRVAAALLGVALAVVAIPLLCRIYRPASSVAPVSSRHPVAEPREGRTRRIAAPLSAEERERASYEEARIEFFRRLRPLCAVHAAKCATGDDPGTLVIETPTEGAAEALQAAAIAGEAGRFGFRKIVVQVRQADDRGRPPTLVTEAVLGPDGRWLTFQR